MTKKILLLTVALAGLVSCTPKIFNQSGLRPTTSAKMHRSNLMPVFDEYEGELSLWVDIHTDPLSYTHTPPYKKGCYGYAPDKSKINRVLYGLTVDFHNIIKAETGYSTNITIYDSITYSDYRQPGYGTGRGVPSCVLETSINEYADTGTALLMKYAQEWYGNVIAAMIAAT